MKRLLFSTLVVMALGSGVAWACRCSMEGVTNPELVREAFDYAAFVAEVEIVSSDIVTENRRVSGERLKELDGKEHAQSELYPLQVYVAQLKILKLWKGAATVKSLESGYIGNTCGNIRFHAGDKLLLYANETDQADRVSTWHCMRTRPLAEAKEDLDLIATFASSPGG
jgi:hypothetical protein